MSLFVLSPCILGLLGNPCTNYIFSVFRFCHRINKGEIVIVYNVNPIDKPCEGSMSCKYLMCSQVQGKQKTISHIRFVHFTKGIKHAFHIIY